MEFSKIFTVKKEVTEQQFLRNVLIGLSKDKKSPSNIMNAKFGKVTEFEAEVMVLSADVEVNYSGSCGYDRQEQYQTTESRYVREGEWYVSNGIKKRASYSGSVKVDVVKTKTVTDWSPHNGTINTNKLCFCLNKDNGDENLLDLFSTAFEEANDESVIEEGSANVNSSAYKFLLSNCETKATRDVKWPGDHHKDETYNCKTDVNELVCYIVPCYKVEFEYNRKKYCARGFAIGKANEVHEVPQSDGKVESIEKIENRRKIMVHEAEKPLKIKKLFVTLAIIMGFVGLYGIVNNGTPNCGAEVCLPLGLISMAVFIVIAIVINIKVKNAVAAVNALANIEKKKLNNIKVNNLIEVLKKLNLPALSAAEKKWD
ncbi:MAG: hypothetical protein IJF75_03055 [Clostridia bacterium]|nr:hypothetical protein [Clostridia bacterium]MBQ4122501.1 hypothetical protein [bacterium]